MKTNIEESQPKIHYPSATPVMPLSDDDILSRAKTIIKQRFMRSNYLTSPDITRSFLTMELAQEEREVFGIILLDSQHGVIEFNPLFYGTIDGASVYPRDVIKTALNANAAAVILAHNHPSGHAQPSEADKRITEKIITALQTIEIRVLDHLIIGGLTSYSFAENGLI